MGRKKKYYTKEEKLEAKRKDRKKYREANKVKVNEQIVNWKVKNPDKVKIYLKNYKPSEEQKVNRKVYMKEYLKTYKDRVKQRKIDDPLFRLTYNTRSLVNGSITRNGYKKSSKTYKILGCSFEEFKQHLESQWESWMNWGNYGKYNGKENFGWDIDHRTPSSSALNEDDIIKLNHHSNLQPLCSKINRDIKKDLMDF